MALNNATITARMEHGSEFMGQVMLEVDEIEARYHEALKALREADPKGWREWYDDDKNVPDFFNWFFAEPAIEAMINRVQYLSPSMDQE